MALHQPNTASSERGLLTKRHNADVTHSNDNGKALKETGHHPVTNAHVATLSKNNGCLTSSSAKCLSLQRQAKPRAKRNAAISNPAPPAETLEALAQKVAQQQDRVAFKALFAHFAPRIKSFLLKQKVSDEVAEDLTQEVMVTVWQKAHMFDPGKARLSTWIFRIARNKFIDRIRRQKYVEVDVDNHIQSMEASEKTDEPVIQNQDKARILKAMEQLKPDLRAVIELSFYKDLSHSQIAEKLQLPLGTVKSRIRIAFQKLRVELGDF